ncbi:MAG: PhzF family phenazine biosynthesis protein [Pyrinomonadaceae bacterium]
MKLDIYQVDAFASEVFTGNPAAVVPLEEWLPAESMQKIAAENNLAETAFFVREGDGYGLRWFTPTVEIGLCGHATLASAHVISEFLGDSSKALKFQSKGGELIVRRNDKLLELDFPARPSHSTEAYPELVDAIGKQPESCLRSSDCMFVFETEDEVAALSPNFNILEGLDEHAVIVTAPGKEYDFVSRFFAPAVGVNEDPVTGSAHCTLIPYWSERLGKKEMVAKQISARGGVIRCTFLGERVLMAGTAVLYMKGEIYI